MARHAALTPGRPDPRAVARWRRYVGPLIRLAFRPTLSGVEHIPADRPVMIVANHSGLGIAEIASLIVCLPEHLSIAPMVHAISMQGPAGGWMRRLGAIPSTYEAARAALADGASVLVFPGGDHESMRPVWQANRVDFNGRQGFLAIARGAGVAVVPLGIRGSHYTAPVVYRSRGLLPRLLVLPYLFGVRKRFPVTLAGVLGVAALIAFGPVGTWWLTAVLGVLVLATPVSQLPWVPWTVRMQVGEPIPHDQLFTDDGALDVPYERVRGAVEAQARRKAA